MKDFWNKIVEQNTIDILCNITQNDWRKSEPLTFDKIKETLKLLPPIPDFLCSIYCLEGTICKIENTNYLHPNSLRKLEELGMYFTLEFKYSNNSGRYKSSGSFKPSVELPPYK